LATVLPAAAQQPPAPLALRVAPRAAIGSTALSTILGNALDWANAVLPDAPVRVRDVQSGSIVRTALTDKVGVYTFKGLDPGNYVVEIVGVDQAAVAASNLINANAGQTVRTSVKIPFKPAMLPNVLGAQPAPPPVERTAAVVATGTAISER
jgi:hypothetical protein